jgi:two-component system sensor histidine kinase/response regulator
MEPVKPKILVVDDNEANRELARATLDDEGYEVVLASSGDEALQMFERVNPDCVLLDVRMQGMDGFAVCSAIRALPGGTQTPVVFLTALRDVDTFDRALRAGGDDFLTKPVRPTELVIRVQAALKLVQMRAELKGSYDLLRRQRDDLMRLQLQKERLSEFLVHDLKNPVATMDLHAQLLLQEPNLSDLARESALAIREDARALVRLLLNLLDVSKSEEGALVPQIGMVELRPLVADVMHGFELKARTVGVDVAASVEVERMRADPDLLRRVLENLLDNALRHAPKQTVVRLSVRDADDAVEFAVADAGSGVPAEMRDQIFDRFVQLQSGKGTATRTGRGLGLAFCKVAVEAHRGRIWIEDGNPGAVFRLRFPHER